MSEALAVVLYQGHDLLQLVALPICRLHVPVQAYKNERMHDRVEFVLVGKPIATTEKYRFSFNPCIHSLVCAREKEWIGPGYPPTARALSPVASSPYVQAYSALNPGSLAVFVAFKSRNSFSCRAWM